MLRLIGIMISIGLADSINPSTVAPALVLGSLQHPRRRVAELTVGVFSVYLLGGALIALGPGQLLLSLVPRPSHTATNVLEIVAGTALLIAATLLIVHHERLGRKPLPTGGADGRGRSSFLLGAGIMTVELPTAFPYFAAIAAIVGSGQGVAGQVIALVVFNACFVLPLVGILAVLVIWRERAPAALARARKLLERRWPMTLAVVALLAGAFAITLGATGLAHGPHGRVGVPSRQLR